MEPFGKMKARTATTVHCSASPRSSGYAKSRRDSVSARHIYAALLCGAVCFSTWALLSHQVSSSLPTHGPSSIWSQHSSSSSSSSSRGEGTALSFSSRRGPSSILASFHTGALGPSKAAASAAANTVAAAAAAVLGAKGATRRLTFQRTKTAMPFIMMTCRMCDDPMSHQIQQIKMYDPVTSTLVEHALSSAPHGTRVFVEVGAGTGYFSMLAASWQSDVVAFEPNATARQILSYNAAMHKDGRVRVLPYAVGAKTTLATFNKNDSSSSSSNSTASQALGPVPAADSTSSNNNSSSSSRSSSSGKAWGVDVLRLSDAFNSDAEMTVVLINVPTLDGQSVPGFVEAIEGAYGMLKRAKWVFLLGLPNYNAPQIRAVLADMLQHGNFSNLYSYGAPSDQQQQDDDAELEPQQQQQQQQQDTAISVAYPADTHYVDITEAIRARTYDLKLNHHDFVFTRDPISGTLQINIPKKLVWDWEVQQNAANNSSSSSNGTAADAAAADAAPGAVQEQQQQHGAETQQQQ